MDIISIPKPIFYPVIAQSHEIDTNKSFVINLDSGAVNSYCTVKFITKNETGPNCTYFKKKFLIRQTVQEDKSYKVFTDEVIPLSILTMDRSLVITNNNNYKIQLNYEVKKFFI